MAHTIGIDIGGTKITGGLIKRDKIIKKFETDTGSRIVKRIKDVIRGLMKGQKASRIGIGCAGLVDPKKGIVYYSPNIREFKDTKLARIIEQEFKVKTMILNDVNAFLLAEWLYGAGRGHKDLIGLTVGTGIGGAAIVNNTMLWGKGFMAGEFGHIVISKNGPRCSCGKKGCLEIMGAQKAVMRLAKKKGFSKLDPKDIAEFAKRGNKKAISIYDQIGYNLAIGIGNLINIFDPEVVIIGGGITNAGGVLFDPIKRYIPNQVMDHTHRKIKIVKARLGSAANIIGAAAFEKKLLPTP